MQPQDVVAACRNGADHKFILVMGVAGTGKSEMGRRLAHLLDSAFVEADDLHSPENVERMRNGHALTDALRVPWLNAVSDRALSIDGSHVVIACSALKRSYRDLLRQRLCQVRFLFLHGSQELIASRLGARTGHFATGSLLQSQLDTLEIPEPDEEVIWLDIALPVEDLAGIAMIALGMFAASA